jgi:uncharacterized protein YbjQ (UPF0145 family)
VLITTTATIEGYPVQRYLGVVTGEAIVGTNFMRDMFARITDVVGGRSGGYEKALADARRAALESAREEALALGANALLAVDIDYESVGERNALLLVSVSGTAAVIGAVRRPPPAE